MATHSGILSWGIPWTEELGRSTPQGHKELDMTEQLTTAQHTESINNVVLASGMQQSDSVIHLSIPFQILSPFRLLQNIE